MRSRPWQLLLAVPVTVAVIGAAATASVAAAAATAGPHPIRPGTSVTIAGITCSAGAVLRQKSTVYVAIPASCAGLEPGKVQNGCTQAEAPIGTSAQVAGARHRALLVYNSFTRMQFLGTARRHTTAGRRLCHYNDLALIRLDPRDDSRVSGAIAGMRAPTSVRRHAPASGHSMTIGRDSAMAGASHQGGWELDVTSSSPLSSSDLGSAAVAGGKLLGMLTVLPGSPVPGLPTAAVAESPAEVYNLHKALVFMHKMHRFRHVSLLAAGHHA